MRTCRANSSVRLLLFVGCLPAGLTLCEPVGHSFPNDGALLALTEPQILPRVLTYKRHRQAAQATQRLLPSAADNSPKMLSVPSGTEIQKGSNAL